MTKDELKFYIDNMENFWGDINNSGIALPEENQEQIDRAYDTGINNSSIIRLYEIYKQYFGNIFEKYRINLDAFVQMMAIGDISYSEQLLGKEGSIQLIKDIFDIYGEEGLEILGLNSSFAAEDIPQIAKIIDDPDGSQYEQYYITLINNQCKNANTFDELKNVLKYIKEDYISEELLVGFLENENDFSHYWSYDEIFDFLNEVPDKIVGTKVMKVLLEKSNRIDSRIFQLIGNAYLNQDFIEWFQREGLNLIAEKSSIYLLPEYLMDEKTHEWCNNRILELISNKSIGLNDFIRLPDDMKTSDICMALAENMNEDDIRWHANDFWKAIPKDQLNRTILEVLIEKNATMLGKISKDSFETGLSQEEYDKWVEGYILKLASQTSNIEEVISYLPRERYNEKTWNAILDKCIELGQDRVGIEKVPLDNRTLEMYERAISLDKFQFFKAECIGRKLDDLSPTLREEYERWIANLTKEQKEEYSKWYETKAIDLIRNNVGGNIFRKFEFQRSYTIPQEAITINMIKAYLDKEGPFRLEDIPLPNELTNYNDQFEDIVLYAISKFKEKKELSTPEAYEIIYIEGHDFLSIIPEEYRTDKVILEAIKIHPKYLNYTDEKSEEFEKLLTIGYSEQLKQLGKDSFTSDELDLIKDFKKHNANLFSTLDIEILKSEIVKCIGKESLSRIVRYKDVQSHIIAMSNNMDTLRVFGYVLDEVREDNLFIEPLMEKIGIQSRRQFL